MAITERIAEWHSTCYECNGNTRSAQSVIRDLFTEKMNAQLLNSNTLEILDGIIRSFFTEIQLTLKE